MNDAEKEMFSNLSKSNLGKTFRAYCEKKIREHADVRTMTEESLQARKDSIKFIDETFMQPLKIMSGEVVEGESDYT